MMGFFWILFLLGGLLFVLGLGGTWLMRRGQEGLGFGFLFLLGLLAVLVSVAVWIIRRVGHDRGGAVPSVAASDPLDIARQRLAAGEITLEEHEEIRERLRH